MHVRAGQPGDAPQVAAHALALAEESEGRRPDPATVRASVRAALADPSKARYFVAEDGGRVVGSLFVTFEWSDWSNGWYWWIQGLYVEPERRRQGIHRALHDEVRRAAREAGDVRRIRLYVHEDNPARAAYERLGMAEQPYRIYDAPV